MKFYFWVGTLIVQSVILCTIKVPTQEFNQELIKTHCLCDVWRDLNIDVRQYTWAHNRGNFISFARLDRFYCFRHHCNIAKGCFITPTVFSDHCLVTCNVFIANVKPKSAYWHFNTSLFSDVNFRDVFVFFWNNFRLRNQCLKNLRQSTTVERLK